MTRSIHYQNLLIEQLPIPTKLLTSYKSLGLNETETMLVLQLHRFLSEKNEFPTPGELAQTSTLNEQECAKTLRKLIQKNYLSIQQKQNKENRVSEVYSLDPLWNILFTESKPKTETEYEDGTLFILFEQEFGRPISPFEIETINVWLDEDDLEPSLIKAALRESVLMGKLNFKYIDRILREWKKKGILTVEQARESSKNFHKKQTTPSNKDTEKRDTSFYYNWLEGED
ncbi:DNA replication protein DnaD [Virgibacillus phasianinus]|uniref:DNA replication protein DnaD n=1 Tax=Virgibacillus phasianinus TaxID=2017483 RepID=A0A220U5Q4_9BACI|nr:DnaD domain-containing protein [Virgibacillus phasianinus]ASK63365.1 DNA replication protein DnaD [Virgibacillus phasianinus]